MQNGNILIHNKCTEWQGISSSISFRFSNLRGYFEPNFDPFFKGINTRKLLNPKLIDEIRFNLAHLLYVFYFAPIIPKISSVKVAACYSFLKTT